ncbi:MAG: FecR domain-containing protein [Thermodesulfobacteriota bacterium]
MPAPFFLKIKICWLIPLWLAIFLSPLSYAAEEATFELKVVKGDKLINICQKYLEAPQKWKEVAAINKLKNPDLIYPGQILIIPVRLLKGTPLEARVSFIKGEVLIQEKDKETWIQLNLNDRVRQGSTIKTGDKAAVEITFEDGASFFLKAHTTLGLTTAEKKGEFYSARKLFLQKGSSFLRSVPPSGTRSRTEVVTQNAVAGVRGTDFRVSVDQEGTTRLEVLKGAIELEAMKQKVEVKEGEGSLVKKDEPPLRPRKLLPPPSPVDLEPIYKVMPFFIKFTLIEKAVYYRVTLAKDKDIKDIVQEKIISPTEKFSLRDMEDGLYYLQSISIDDLGIEGFPSPPVEIRIRVHPQPPYIQSPAESAELKKKSVIFKWLKVPQALHYRLQIAEDKEFKNLVRDEQEIKATEFKVDELAFKQYWFRIRSVAADGHEGIWSDPLTFTILPPPPAPPLDKPEVSEETITIRWRDLGKGIRYEFQMAKDPDFRHILITKEIEKPEYIFPKPAEVGTYYVRTRGIDPDGYTGDFSRPQSFALKPPPPSPPFIEKVDVGWKEMHIKWTNLGKEIRYILQIAEDEGFQKIFSEKEAILPEITLPKPLEIGRYWVRVKAIAPDGRESRFSSPQIFNITHGVPYIPLGFFIVIGLVLLAL